jgi:DNA-binding transcriptional ArsR family regulator
MSKKRVERIARAAVVFAALGDPVRLAVLQRLAQEGPASISTLAEQFSITRQGVTKHLNVLEAADVLGGQRQGRERVYEIKAARLAEAQQWLAIIASGWDDALSRLKAHVESS